MGELAGRRLVNDQGELIRPARDGEGCDIYISTSSAGGGLQMMVAGIVREMTAASAKRAALGAGAMVSLVLALLSAVFNYAYLAFIDPGYPDVMIQYKMDQLQAKGISGAQLEQAEKYTRMLMNPVPATIITLVYLFILGFIISLIVAIFLKRPAPANPPSL